MTTVLSHADLAARLRALGRLRRTESPVVSVYLGADWSDERQRERARAFLRDELAKARIGAAPELEADLAWVEWRSEALLAQRRLPETRAVVLFACRSAGLREVLPLRTPVEELFTVADSPYLARLAEALENLPAA